VPLICLGGALSLVWQMHGAPPASWYRLLMFHVALGASPAGWQASPSSEAT